jgi:hypothetical protein
MSVLRLQTPDYEDAVDLAMLEEIWINKNTRLASIVASSRSITKIPVGFYAMSVRWIVWRRCWAWSDTTTVAV